MSSAEEIQIIRPGWAVWSAYDPTVRVELWSTAVQTGAGWVIIDPIPLAAGALEEVLAGGKVAAIAMTNGNHARACEEYRDRLQAPIAAHPAAAKEAGLDVDLWLDPRTSFAPGVRVVDLPGGGLGEVALVFADGLCVVGDILVNLPSHPFQLLPAKYCTDARVARLSLLELPKLEGWDALGFAHGEPLTSGAQARLAALLAE